MKKIGLFFLLGLMIILLAACGTDEELIGMQRLEYEPERAELLIYYFPSRIEADTYFEGEGVEDYFLFEIPAETIIAEEVFQDLPGTKLEEHKKELILVDDGQRTAREQVVDILDDNNMRRVHGPDD